MTPKLTDGEIKRLLLVIAERELHGEIFWHTDLTFMVNCNDLFHWAFADAELIESSNDIDQLDAACKEAGYDGASLYCARRRKMRPQGACYKHLDEKNWPLFDACGPEREVGFGNPAKHP